MNKLITLSYSTDSRPSHDKDLGFGAAVLTGGVFLYISLQWINDWFKPRQTGSQLINSAHQINVTRENDLTKFGRAVNGIEDLGSLKKAVKIWKTVNPTKVEFPPKKYAPIFVGHHKFYCQSLEENKEDTHKDLIQLMNELCVPILDELYDNEVICEKEIRRAVLKSVGHSPSRD